MPRWHVCSINSRLERDQAWAAVAMTTQANLAQIADYLDSLLTLRKLSPHTVSGYRIDLLELAAFADTGTLAAIGQPAIRRFAAKLHAKGLNPRSIARKLSAWRGFFEWLARQTTLTCNPVDGVKGPKRANALPKALPVDDAVQLVSGQRPGSVPTPHEICNRAMFELLYSSGLRVSELAGLDVHFFRHNPAPGQIAAYVSSGWIDFDGGEVTVTGKGDKMRTVPVGQAALAALRAWLAVRPTLANPGGNADGQPADSDAMALFLNQRGKRISPRVLQLRLKAHALMIGTPANVHPHVLRHSFASHVLQSSGDLRAVQEMLGHTAITSTQVYTALDFQRLAQVYDAAHPRAKRK